MPRTVFASPPRRRRSPIGTLLIIVLLLLIAFLVYLWSKDTEVPLQRIEQDVTNEVLAD